jgi:hypothetical protein
MSKADEDRCASRGCKRPVANGRATITAKDGKKYCRRHGDRLPSYLRRAPAKAKRSAEPAEPTGPTEPVGPSWGGMDHRLGGGMGDIPRLPSGF